MAGLVKPNSSESAVAAFSWTLFGKYTIAPSHALLLRIGVLALICISAFAIRLFAVLRYESIIHEFDPYFNFRSTKYLVENGFYSFRNWFDDFTWYPLGRMIGSTVFPGLMATSALLYWALHAINITVDIRNVCVFLAPLFAAFTCLVAYSLTKTVSNARAGLLAAAIMSVVPGYISRSVAGSYDNECVAIFALINSFYWFVRSVQTGSLLHSSFSALAYFYMVNCWGGYIFIANLVPLYVIAMLFMGRYSRRLYIAYSIFFVLGTILAMQVRFVGFAAILSSEHMLLFVAFAAVQLYAFSMWLRSLLSETQFKILIKTLAVSVASVAGFFLVLGTAFGIISPFSGRLYSLLDPTYAKDHIPIIASVSEHQPTSWGSFFFDLYFLTVFMPVGFYFIIIKKTNRPKINATEDQSADGEEAVRDGALFLAVYCLSSVYFAGVMVRLMLVLAPAAVMVSSIGISGLLDSYMLPIKQALVASGSASATPSSSSKKSSTSSSSSSSKELRKGGLPWTIATVLVLTLTFFLFNFQWHGLWVTSEAYSSPSIVLSARGHNGQRIIFDDFREAYYWLRMNTAEDAKVMSWWDYGYQITAMANRTVLVDNNTWNNTHIATVGRAMNADEDTSIQIMRALDVDYVLVVFGGLSGYASDDINKFLWMVRISGSVDKNVVETDWYSKHGFYTSGPTASDTMTNSVMYKCSYYRFGEVTTDYNQPTGYDRARGYEIAVKDVKLKYLEEAFTSEHWMVRIYRVKKPQATQ
eukprot:ANDGO_02757.mRNA.1 Dolichyl-diphosphooligosaccharide--protein glycosyltransferase subunit STT3